MYLAMKFDDEPGPLKVTHLILELIPRPVAIEWDRIENAAYQRLVIEGEV